MIVRWMLALSMALAPAMAAAQAPGPNPSLTASANGIRDAGHARALTLRKFDVAVTLHGAIAETVVTAAFDNQSRETLEGDFRLQLPSGAVVTGYALDIGDAMVDGVLVDRPRAKAVYEAAVRRGVDPGVAEVSQGGEFRTRVFPIQPGRGRVIRVRFVAALFAAPYAEESYILPLRTAAPREGWSISVRTSGGAVAPSLGWPGHSDAVMSRDGAGWAVAERGKGGLIGPLTIRRPVLPDAESSRNALGERYLQLAGATGAAPAAGQTGRVRIYWDRSRSRLDDRLDAELALLRRALDALRPAAIEVVTFNSSGAERRTVADADAAVALLRGVRYRGATSFAPLAADTAPADRCLLFSDGLATVDRAASVALRCRLDAVATAPDADIGWLRHLAAIHGGRAFALGDNAIQVVAALASGAPSVTAVLDDAGNRLAFVPVESGPGRWLVLARAPDRGGVRVQLGNAVVRREVPATDIQFDGESALLAADALTMLGATEQRADYVALSRRYGIASPSLSFLVLETPQDYLAAGIEPPAGYPAALFDGWRQLFKRDAEEKERARSERLGNVVRLWEDQVAWWRRDFDPYLKPEPAVRTPRPRPRPQPSATRDRVLRSEPAPAPPPASPPESFAGADTEGDEIVTTGSRISRPALESSSPVTVVSSSELRRNSDGVVANDVGELIDRNDKAGAAAEGPPAIQIDAWQPDRPYLKAFDAAPADFDKLFAAEEARSGGIPAFYLDSAEWLRRHGRGADAAEMVLAALDLPSANDVTLGIAADRLERYGDLDRAVELRERQAALDPDRPQPKRFLALALARRAAARPATARADLERAIALLSEVALTPTSSAWDGIEVIALTEANALIPRLRALGGKADLDSRLIALLDMDVRVVVDWTTDATDLDLWVDEPGGERAIYNHPRTRIGGHLSNDMTAGYGPEQYFVRRAPDGGVFVVQANVFASDRIDPNGPSLLTAHLIRDFGRPTQREEAVDIELTRAGNGGRMIGRIVIEPGKK
ncbi:MAG: VIT domain-containing protein [Pseudomonadota bacterium]